MASDEPEMSQTHLGGHGAPSITSQHGLAEYPASIAARSARSDAEDDPFADPAVAGPSTGPGTAAAAGGAAGGAAAVHGVHEDDAPAAGAGAGAAAAAPTKFYKKPAFILTLIVGMTMGLVVLFILLFPLVHGVADRILNVVNMDIRSAIIRNPTNESFDLQLGGFIYNTGHINAKLTFNQPVRVYWVTGSISTLNETETLLGHVNLSPVHSKSARATLDQHATFYIADQKEFGNFAAELITAERFKWRLKSEDVTAEALKFPVVNGLALNRDVEVMGINSFHGQIALESFQLPGDAPDGGGIEFVAGTQLINPSPFDISLGDVAFDLYAQDVYLGRGVGSSVRIAASGPSDVTLSGNLVPHLNDTHALDVLGQVFSSYVSDETYPVRAVGLYTRQSNGDTISWLTQGVEALTLTVPLKSPTPLNPIQSIDIGYLNLSFTEQDMWAPQTNTDKITAMLALPFGFAVDVSHIQNEFTIYQNGTALANLSTPDGAATSDIHTYSSSNISGPVFIDIFNTSLSVLPDSHDAFTQFTRGLTVSPQSNFQLVGSSRAITKLSIGTITLDPIKFNVSSSLVGLNSLNTRPTTVNSVDVLGGTADHIELAIGVTIYNPANLNLQVGDLYLMLYNGKSAVGTVLLPNLNLLEGVNTLAVTGNFTPDTSAAGLDTLNAFVGGRDTALTISGYENSTELESLLLAFESLSINTTLPGLKSKLLETTALEVLSTTGYNNDNTTHVTVSLVNPFSSALTITYVNSNVSAFGIPLGAINTQTTFDSKGNSTTVSPNLDMIINLDPPSLFTVLRVLAVQAGLPTEQIDGIVALGGYTYLPVRNTTTNTTSSISTSVFGRDLLDMEVSHELGKRSNVYTGFVLPPFVDKAFALLKADIELVSNLLVGSYATQLTYTQLEVPVKTDASLNLLLPVLARPIVQKIVNGSILGFDTLLISNAQETTFEVALKGAITNAGPFDAIISFPAGLNVAWNGSPLGHIAMPNVTLVADVGADLNLSAAFTVANTDNLAAFTKVLLTNETFAWDIYGENLSVAALGIDVGLITINKSVTLTGFNGLKNGVIIDSFDLPANDPEGGIHLTLNTTVTNPSQVGIALSGIGFRNFFQSTYIGPAQAGGAFTLAPKGTTQLPLVGRLVPQNGSDQGLTDMGTVFTNYVHGIASNLTVNGDTANGPNGPSWLEAGIKALSIPVLLPAPQNLQVIKTITLEDLELNFTDSTVWNPASATKTTLAAFTLPFNFPIDITELASEIAVQYNGNDVAVLPIGLTATSTNVEERIIHLAFSGVPFDVYSDKHDDFAAFLASTTVSENQAFGLSGSANTTAHIAIGDIIIQNIGFDVDTSILGLQGLKTRPTNVSNLDVAHGYSDYLLITVDTALYNPSNITIGTGDVAFAFELQSQQLGVAIISDALIVPGVATYPTNVHYQPSGDAATAVGTTLLQNYISGIDTVTNIVGNSDTTPIGSLQAALSEIQLQATIPAINASLVAQTNIVFPDDIVQTKTAQVTFVLSNPFTAAINLNTVFANATYDNRLDIAVINHITLDTPIHADGHTNVTSQTLPLLFNTDPLTIIALLEAQATLDKVDLGPLIALFQIVLSNPDIQTSIVAQKDSAATAKCVSGHQFDVDGAILKALVGLKVDLAISSSLHLDDYGVSLSFTQKGVPAITDDSALNLIGAVAPPIVQALVNNASLSFSSANISSITDNGFALSLKGSLTGTGPLDAYISFPVPLTVIFQGYHIATIALPPICAFANEGTPDLETSATLTITDENGFASFATYLIHNPEFTWTIASNNVTVSALGYDFLNTQLSKDVSFKGLNGLPGVTISNFQLPGDDSTPGLDYSVDSLIPSPSNLGLDLGTVGFQAYYTTADLGPISGNSLDLKPLVVTSEALNGHILQPTADDLAIVGTLFSNYVSGINATLSVHGDYVDPQNNGDHVPWLTTAFKTLELDVVLEGIKENLVTEAHIEFPTNIATDGGIASANFELANPFGATIRLQSVFANATHKGLYLGLIDVDSLSSPIVASGHTNITSPYLPLNFDIDPIHIIQLLDMLAAETTTDLGPLPDLFKIVLANPTYHPNITATATNSSDGCSSGKQFDVDAAILATLKGLLVDLDVKSNVQLDDITVPLHFTQTNVPAITDDTALYLIGVVAPPIVQALVNQATLSFSTANITNITDNGFSLSLVGQLLDTGPLDALITFPDPIQVTWQGHNIASITLPPICAAANAGVPDLVTNGQLTITDESEFADFTTFLLHNTNFTWTISSTSVRVEALNIIFDGVSLSKDISFAGFNNLPGVTIANFQLPRDDATPGLLYSVDSSIPSPSNLGIDLGTVGFQAFYLTTDLGPISGNDLFLAARAVTIELLTGHILQQSGGDLTNVGTLFSDYISGLNSTLSVHGDYVDPQNNGDQTPWLTTAFKTLVLDVVLPGIKENLVTGTSIVFPTTIATNGGIAEATFGLANPFGVTIRLESVIANATHKGFYLGVIDVPQLSSAIVDPGHTNITSPQLPFQFDIDPIHIIQLLSMLATERNVDLGPLPELFEIVISNPTFHPNITATPANGTDGCSSGKQFDVDGAILAALKGLLVDLDVQSNVQLDDITVPLHFSQTDVPAVTDDTALYLITVVAPPIVQTLVNQATLSFSSANITDVTDNGFSISLVGQLLDTGPLDALITFVEPITIIWENQDIATITLPPICAAANSGVPDLRTNGQLTITDQGGFADFTTFLLHNANFTWTITSTAVRVEALNIIFDGVSLTKEISFLGFNNLPGVTISNFNLPSDDPAGGITISTDSLIPSPSNLGIDLGTVGFEAFYNGLDIGPLTAQNLDLLPLAVTTEHLTGRLIPQSGSGLDTIGQLFSDYLAGDNSTLQVKGSYVDGAQGSPVSWLTTAFKTLSLDVVLPGHIYQIIYSIALNDLELIMINGGEAFAPLTSTKDTVATFKNPFGFSLTPIRSAENITLSALGNDIATLNVPSAAVDAGTSTGNIADLTLSFQNVPLQSVNNGLFPVFLAAVTDTNGIAPELKGTVNIVADTKIGDVPISGIPFNVTSEIKGIDGFGGKLGISNVSITGSGGNGAYILAPLTASLDNPSNISLETNDVSLPTYYKDTLVGRAVLNTLDLVPGTADYPAEFHYEPADANDTVAQSFLTQYLQYTAPIDLTIKGDGSSSPYGSLVPALEGLNLAGSFNGIGTRLVTHINVYITLGTLLTNEVEIDFDAANALDTEITVEFVQNDSGVNGEIYAHFDEPFTGFNIPAHGAANSGTVPHVKLVKGALLTLPIIPLGYLDIANALTINVGGYVIPWLQYSEKNIPTTYHLDLLGVVTTEPSVISSVIAQAQSLSIARTQSIASTASVASISAISVSDASITEALSVLSELSLASVLSVKSLGALTSDIAKTSVLASLTEHGPATTTHADAPTTTAAAPSTTAAPPASSSAPA